MYILTFDGSATKKVKNTICKCGITIIHICFFLSIFRICRTCITSTRSILYGKISDTIIQSHKRQLEFEWAKKKKT